MSEGCLTVPRECEPEIEPQQNYICPAECHTWATLF